MRRIGLFAGLVLLSACGNMLNPEGKTATPAPSPLPSGVANVNASDEQLAPGRYARFDFSPRVTFEVEGPWYAVNATNVFRGAFFDIQQEPGVAEPTGPPAPDSTDVIAVQFARPDSVYGADGTQVPTDAADAVAILETNPDITVVETDTSRWAASRAARSRSRTPATRPPSLHGPAPGTLAINPDRRLWIAFFDTDEGLLAIMVGGSIEGWDEALATAEPGARVGRDRAVGSAALRRAVGTRPHRRGTRPRGRRGRAARG